MNERLLSDAEMLGVSKTSPEKQYAYWIRNLIEFQQVWYLEGAEGVFGYVNASLKECIPIWCHQKFSKWYLENIERERELRIVNISLSIFQGDLIPALQRQARLIAAGPFLGTNAVIVEPAQVAQQLKDEMKFRF